MSQRYPIAGSPLQIGRNRYLDYKGRPVMDSCNPTTGNFGCVFEGHYQTDETDEDNWKLVAVKTLLDPVTHAIDLKVNLVTVISSYDKRRETKGNTFARYMQKHYSLVATIL